MSARRETHKHAIIPLAGHAGLTDQLHEVSRFGVSEADALAELWPGFDEERASLSGDRAEKDVH